MIRTHEETEDLLSQLVVEVAGLECLRDVFLNLFSEWVPEDRLEEATQALRSASVQRWNAESYRYSVSVAQRVGLKTEGSLERLAEHGSPLLPIEGSHGGIQ